MLHLFFEIWYSIPIAWRRLLTALPLVIGIVATVLTWDWIPIASGAVVSFILFVLPGASESEKKGYNF